MEPKLEREIKTRESSAHREKLVTFKGREVTMRPKDRYIEVQVGVSRRVNDMGQRQNSDFLSRSNTE